MPQYEVQTPAGEVRRIRARDIVDAARRAGLAEGDLRVETEADVQGWRLIQSTASPESVGRVREFARMRFRRD